MFKPILPALFVAFPAVTSAQSTPPPLRWDVTSTVVDLVVPGAPGFLLKMAKGKSRAEHKCLPVGQPIAALLAPDPKAQCLVASQHVADGRYVQTLTCPQRHGEPTRINRIGTYNDNGFVGRAEMTAETPKGPMHIVLDQRAARVSGKCRD